jgi:membrane associated rhomboid family serine protease
VELLSFSEVTDQTLFSSVSTQLSLPPTFGTWLVQPWSILTHTLIYQDIFHILFDCLWLYWIGNLFLDFLNRRQFLTVFGTGLFGGAIFYLLIGQFGFINTMSYWTSMSFGIAALISAITALLPTYEIRLFLFGNVKLRMIALIYLALELAFTAWSNPQAAIPLVLCILFGFMFMQQLKSGRDWSKIWKSGKRQKLKVIHRNRTRSVNIEMEGLPSQEQIDQILDKISQNGYDNLTSREKEILFKASKQDQE